jgi:hypothetical protein
VVALVFGADVLVVVAPSMTECELAWPLPAHPATTRSAASKDTCRGTRGCYARRMKRMFLVT